MRGNTMKGSQTRWIARVAFIMCLVLMYTPCLADDTCIFAVTADDVPPNIVLLLDNGAEMEQIAWHPTYDNSVDYTPSVSPQVDVVTNGASGNGFYNQYGYTIYRSATNKYYLRPILSNLLPDPNSDNWLFSSTNTFTINGRSVTLPFNPSTVEVDGIIDNANNFRYSKNYLNWIFYSGAYTGNGSDLPRKSRFYYAKKAIFTVARLTSNKAKFGIYNFTSTSEGSSRVQPLGMVVNTPLAADPAHNTLDPNFVNNINNMGTVIYSPIAEGLAYIGGQYASPSLHVVGEYCQRNFAVVVSPGVSSKDQNGASQYVPTCLSDYDEDSAAGGIGEGNIKADASIYAIPTNLYGSTYLDDVAYYLHVNDVVDYQDGFQNVTTYTVGFMGNRESNLFLINTSNNGNGKVNLYDTSDPEYGRYHFIAEDPDALSSALLSAVNQIISETSTFTAPVVPVTRTTSGNRIYMAFFKPGEGNFWDGNVTKFGLSGNNEIVDCGGNPATWPNGAMREGAEPYWSTKDWADTAKGNYIHNSNRNILTYLGLSTDLTHYTNAFDTNNSDLTAAVLGNPTHTREEIVNYVRGADVFDEDSDIDTTENRALITGDVLHSEPFVLYYNSSTTMIYFGANDGMLHAVLDSDGSEAWSFIPADLLPRVKDMVEGTGHQYYVDSSPVAYIVNDNGDGEIGAGEQVILLCGLRKGGTSYFALDVTDPFGPSLLWTINQGVISELGETWSEPVFGLVRTSEGDTTGTPVMFIGGGYSSDNSKGKAVIAINVQTGAVVKMFSGITGMDYSFASSIAVLDTDSNGFVDKLYVGDLGSQMWRFGKFTDEGGNPLGFPNSDENITNWEAQILFLADATHGRRFFYPPSIALEKGFDVVFMGTGDREDACNTSSAEGLYCMKDDHTSVTLQESDLVDVTDPAATPPYLDDPAGDVDGNGNVDQGWYIRLAEGEKCLAESTLFYKVFYITTFSPNNDPCLPGGVSNLYALSYLTGEAVMDIDNDTDIERSSEVGGGIASKAVLVITEEGKKLLISVGSTNPETGSKETGAGIVAKDPLAPDNIYYLWWIEL
jgi:type IV pilus assembly protein PilY1